MNSKERNISPGGAADGTNESGVLFHVTGDAGEVKSVRAFGGENGHSMASLHALQANSTAISGEAKTVLEDRKWRSRRRRV